MMAIKAAAGGLLILAMTGGAAMAQSELERGRYLVEQVGLCSDCHSARNPDGSFDKSRWLQGAPIGFKPLVEMPWADQAPSLAGGREGWTRADLEGFLQTGLDPRQQPPRPPMPPYRFTAEDAKAVAAYLHSLPSAGLTASTGGR